MGPVPMHFPKSPQHVASRFTLDGWHLQATAPPCILAAGVYVFATVGASAFGKQPFSILRRAQM